MKTHTTLKIGLTGVIGSGKSAAAEYFAKLGVPIIDADRISREVLANNQAVRSELIAHFGDTIITKDNSIDLIDRKKLRTLVFSDPKKLAWLENLLHPLIEKEMLKQAKKINHPYCIFVIPLLLEKQKTYLVDRVLVVSAPKEQQITRTAARDHSSEEEVRKIIATQLSSQQQLAVAHDVINNDSSLESLKKQVEQLHQKYLALNAALI